MENETKENETTEPRPDGRRARAASGQFCKTDLLSEKELAGYLMRSVAWLQRARWDGSGPPFLKVGRKVLYNFGDIQGWLDTQRRTQTEPAR
jgi:hypothetical protein